MRGARRRRADAGGRGGRRQPGRRGGGLPGGWGDRRRRRRDRCLLLRQPRRRPQLHPHAQIILLDGDHGKSALALMDHLGWKKAHVFGHSMGAMIACKLAAMAPHRLCSLALLNVTGGGFECFPKLDGQMLSLAFRFLRARTPEQRALVYLETHYTMEYLEENVRSCTRRMILYQDTQLLLWDLALDEIVVPLRHPSSGSPTFSSGSPSAHWDTACPPTGVLQPSPKNVRTKQVVPASRNHHQFLSNDKLFSFLGHLLLVSSSLMPDVAVSQYASVANSMVKDNGICSCTDTDSL